MGTSGALMAAAMGVQAVNTYTQAEVQSSAIKDKSKFQAQQAETNARLAEVNAAEAISRGDQSAGVIRRKGQQLKADQRVALAGSGVNINQGSALDLQNETDAMSEIDQVTIKGNAWREAWGYRVEANNTRFTSNIMQIGAQNEAKQTMLTGGLEALGYGLQGVSYASGGKKKTTTYTNTGSGSYSGTMTPYEYESPTFGKL